MIQILRRWRRGWLSQIPAVMRMRTTIRLVLGRHLQLEFIKEEEKNGFTGILQKINALKYVWLIVGRAYSKIK